MSGRTRELAERRAALQLRCALQRHAVAGEVGSILARFESVDRVAGAARGILLRPAVIVTGAIALVVLARAGKLGLLSRALLLAAAARRLLRLAKTL